MNKSLFKGCQKDADGNVVDPITLQEIPEERLLTFMENGKKYCFDIEALAEYTRRGRPENPLTREALSEAVQEQLQTYEERAVLIVDRIVTEGDPFPEELEIKHPKTDTEEELIVGICRVLAESIDHELSADEILSDYLVTKHNEVYQVAKKETYKLLDQVIYYEELANYYEGTSELTVFGEVARTAEDNALIAMPFMEAMSYLMDQYNNIYIGLENRRISDYVITMEDYYKTSPVLFGKRAKVIVGHDAFPLPIPSDWDSELKDFDDAGRRRELEELILQSFRLAMNYAIEISNYTLTKKLLTDRIAFEGSRKLDLDIEQILKEFSTEQAYKLLSQFHLPYNIQFLNDFYKKGLLSDLYRIRDKRAADEILRGKTAYLSDPVSQAQVLLLLPDEQRLKHFKKYEDTLDYEVLYASIPKDSSLLDLLSVEEKIEYGFQTGVRLEDFDQVLVAKLLKNRIRISPRKPFHRNGFALLDNFLDDYPYYMDLSIRYKARYVYLAIFHALLGTEEFASNVCKTTAFKDSLIRQVFREASAAVIESCTNALPWKKAFKAISFDWRNGLTKYQNRLQSKKRSMNFCFMRIVTSKRKYWHTNLFLQINFCSS